MGHAGEQRSPDLAALYDQDLCAWAEANAILLKDGQFSDIDMAHIAEELEDMGKSERRALRSHIRNLIVHLLKWRYQPERRSTSWELTILNARNEIDDILIESPSLVPDIPGYVESVYGAARKATAVETGLAETAFPDTCPFSVDQLKDNSFQPEA